MTNDTDPTLDDAEFLDAARTIRMPTPGRGPRAPGQRASLRRRPAALAPLDAIARRAQSALARGQSAA